MMHLAIAFIRLICSHPNTVAAARWCLRLATRAVAGSLNMPEALVLHTGAFAVAYVAAVEQRATLVCPIKLWRDLKSRRPTSSNRASR